MLSQLPTINWERAVPAAKRPGLAEEQRVWIVDDSPFEAEMARKALGSAFATQTFSDGATMLEQIVEQPLPDVLLLDWLMPGVSGIEVCKFLRAQTATCELPILLLTSQSHTEQIVEGLAAGANDYLVKPYAPAELLARVTAHLRARGLRERANAARLHQAEQKYRALVDGLPDLLIVIVKGRIAFMNPLALEILAGGSPERVIGQPIESIIHPDEREAGLARIAEVAAGGRLPPLAERRLLRHDGSPISVEFRAQSVLLDGEQAVVAVARDISEQKQIQNQLLVSERMASFGQLAAGVAHEINNPLASLLSNLDFALGELKSLSDHSAAFDEVEQSMVEAREAGERLKKIVRDVKIFSRSEDVERRGPVDVQRVLDSSLRMAWNEIRHRALLVKDYGVVLPVLANEAQLGQVFLNLIVNAAQAIPEGRASENQLRIVTRMIDGRVAIEFHDSGVGMSPAVLQKLFTPFFTTKPAGEGTGIGLTICHRIVSGLGGEIRVESQVGQGTAFKVLLPATTLEATEAPVVPLTLGSPGRRGNVLVIDDEVLVAHAIERALGREHEVRSVVSGQLALEQITGGQRFDVILCDLMMPEMTGMEFHAWLREVAPDQASRIIFLTGGAFTSAARDFLALVPNQRLEKPFDSLQLKAIVNDRVRAIIPGVVAA